MYRTINSASCLPNAPFYELLMINGLKEM